MTEAARKLLDSLDALPEAERLEVFREVLRRAALASHGSPTDDDFLVAADAVFLDLDHAEDPE